MMKIGDLVKLTTPDSDDGKVGLLHHQIRPRDRDEVTAYGVQILGETEIRDYLIWEVTSISNGIRA